MTPGARLSAAIEVIADIETRRRPAGILQEQGIAAVDSLKDWGLVHRFAGSADRAAIAGLVYDALRRRASSAHIMGDQRPRAVVLGMLRLERKLDCEAIAVRADGGRFAPAPLSAEERARLGAADLSGAPPWVAGDYPQWLDPYFARVFGEERIAECVGPGDGRRGSFFCGLQFGRLRPVRRERDSPDPESQRAQRKQGHKPHL